MALAPSRVLELNELACRFFEEQARTPAGARALDYVRRRGLSDATIAHWRIGYAPAAGQALMSELGREGWGETALLEAGLLRAGPRGTSDVFRDRLMLPIPDRDGRILAFGSRRLRDDDDSIPKYLNSPETPVFRKSETLYGLPNLADAERAREAWVVEGNLDMLLLWQYGIRAVVAACGTAVTAEHLHQLAAVVPRLTLVLDSDSAGQNATVRSLGLDGAGRLDLGVVTVPGAKDPAELLTEGGLPAWEAAVAARQDRWAWTWDHLAARYGDADVEARIARKDEWCRLVAAGAGTREAATPLFALAERELGLPEGMLLREHGADLATAVGGTDELLLVALAARWQQRAPLADVLTLGGAARAQVKRWQQQATEPELGATLRYRAEQEGDDAEALWVLTMRREVEPKLRAEIGSVLVSDPARAGQLQQLLVAARGA